MSVELGLAAVATIDLVFKHGKKLVNVCRAARNAEQEVHELTIRIESHWVRTSKQLDFLRRIWNRLDVDHQIIQEQMLEILICKLALAETKIGSLITKHGDKSRASIGQHVGFAVQKWRYASRKEDFEKAVKDLEDWSRTFDMSWYATLMNADATVDVALKSSRTTTSVPVLDLAQRVRSMQTSSIGQQKHVFLEESELDSGHVLDLPLSRCQILQRAGSSRVYILNSISVPAQGNAAQVEGDVRELVVRLSYAEPVDFGLLRCKGVMRRQSTTDDLGSSSRTHFTIVFYALNGHPAIRSFRSWLHDGPAKHSLSERLDIAKQMARSISSVHVFGFVHKNIRPENILLCAPTAPALGRAFLVGFEDFRSVDGSSLRCNDPAWEKELYRHPSRQGTIPTDTYVMQHDIYSLGVCLLELGLWETFVVYDNDGQCMLSATLSACDENLLFSDSPGLFKQPLLHLAQNVLPLRMGTKFAKIVETCLTCLDESNLDFGSLVHFQRSRGASVGVRYIEKVRSDVLWFLRGQRQY